MSLSLVNLIFILLSIIITVIFIALYTLHSNIIYILGLGGFLAGLGLSILGFELYRQQKKLKEIDKGRKILETRQRRYEILPKSLRYAMIFVCCLLTFGIVVSVIIEHYFHILPLASVLICNLIIFLVEIRYEIYEKGILYGMQFIKWDEIKKVKWENGILKIKAEKVIGSIMIRDEDKRIKNIVEKYLRWVKLYKTKLKSLVVLLAGIVSSIKVGSSLTPKIWKVIPA